MYLSPALIRINTVCTYVTVALRCKAIERIGNALSTLQSCVQNCVKYVDMEGFAETYVHTHVDTIALSCFTPKCT